MSFVHLTDLPRTSSFRIALLFMALFGLAAALLFGFLYWRTTSYLMAEADTELLAEERALTGASAEEFRLRLDGRQARDPMGYRPFGAFRPDGSPIAGNLTRLPIHNPPLDQPFSYSRLLNGRLVEFRARAHRLPSGVLVVVSQTIADQNEFGRVLRDSMLYGGLLVLILGLIGAVIMGTGSVRRLQQLTWSLEQIVSGGLVARLPRQGRNDEIDRLVDQVNSMLDEIERLMYEVKGVCDGIAHDLRTPLTRLLSGLERVHRQQNARPEDYVAAIDEATLEIQGLLRTFGALLRISEIEDSARRAGFEDVDLLRIAADVLEFYEPAAEENRLTMNFDTGGLSALPMRGDPNLLFEAIGNLVDNAIKFTPPGGSVTVRADSTGITVSDTGPGIIPEEWEAVLRRFYRVGRSRSTPGNGLGLSLVAAITRLHGLHLEIGDARPGCRVYMKLT